MCFDLVAAVFVIMMGQWYTFMTNFLENSLFSFIPIRMVAMEIGEKAISHLPQQQLLRGKKASSKT